MIEPVITIADTLPKEICDEICAPLGAYNREQNAAFFGMRDLPENAQRDLSIVARDPAGKIIGGLLGRTQFTWLKIDILAIVPEARQRGLGTLLMKKAEDEGRARGCIYAYVDTTSYQAPLFYEKLGYNEVGRLRDWDSHGHDKIMFTKRLS
jgi:ribosomal protein S18 acetylase RimI-like enzyme